LAGILMDDQKNEEIKKLTMDKPISYSATKTFGNFEITPS
jgi:hypothetical protein